MRVGALFSGGKDSTYAAWLASKAETLACLITLFPKTANSYMFHFPNVQWTTLQAEAMGTPQVTEMTEGLKEVELLDLRRTIARARVEHGIEGVYTGAMASVYQKKRVEAICAQEGLDCVSPLWEIDAEQHLRRLVAQGFDVMVVSVSALGLDRSWLGRKIDDNAIDELVSLGTRYKFHVGFEGGEAETFVLDCPLFSREIEILASETSWRGDRGVYEITQARFSEKPTQAARV